MHLSQKSGFTLVEILVVVAIMGIIALAVVPSIGGVMDGAEDNNAKSYAVALKSGKQTFRLRVADAANQYSSAGNNNARYSLIQPYIDGGSSPASLSGFIGNEYSANLGANLNDPVTVTAPSGNTFSSAQ